MGSMPFLYALVMPQPDGTLETTVCRKATHIDLYLHWDNQHTISEKYSVVSTLNHRARALCSNPQFLQQEEEHLQKVLLRYNYPIWALNRIKIKNSSNPNPENNNNHSTNQHNSTTTIPNKKKACIIVLYIKGLREF